VTIGGGQAIIADIQRQVVDVHGWMTHAQFGVDFAISRMAPGHRLSSPVTGARKPPLAVEERDSTWLGFA
jgi:hypothetical protein